MYCGGHVTSGKRHAFYVNKHASCVHWSALGVERWRDEAGTV